MPNVSHSRADANVFPAVTIFPLNVIKICKEQVLASRLESVHTVHSYFHVKSLGALCGVAHCSSITLCQAVAMNFLDSCCAALRAWWMVSERTPASVVLAVCNEGADAS